MPTKRLNAVIAKEEKWYVARCLELGVVSQGKTMEEAQANLREAVELYIESFGEEEWGSSLFMCLRGSPRDMSNCP